MSRTTYVLRGGELVEKSAAYVAASSGPHVISDTMDPIRSMADGLLYDSKAVYRRSLRDRGLIEVGNERAPYDQRREFDPGPVAPDIKRAIEQLEAR